MVDDKKDESELDPADLYDEDGNSLYDHRNVENDSLMQANPGGLLASRQEEEKANSGQITPTSELEPRIALPM